MQEEIKKQIQGLIEKYESAKSTTGIRRYSEEDTIKDFILPLFNILEWNTSAKEEVSAQDHIKGSGRPDYTFKINGITQFYLEAKKLSANLDDEKFAFQAINYSWNKGITYAILTDFESIKVFNAQRIDKINLMDKLVFEIHYTKYIEEFDTLWHLSKTAFKDKKLDSLAEKYGKKEKSISVSSVTKKLNEDIQWCRQRLTHSFEVCNKDKNIPKDLLDEGVQKLLDRLIFLRVAEDRDVEPNILKNLLRQADTAEGYTPFQAMVSTFRELDKTYNSNLFSHHPFEEWEEWSGALKKVIERLYGKEGYYAYNFKEMPADVLGSVYESYLGYKLQTAKSKNKKLFDDEGREITIHKDAKKRKEQGIYYTPIFVVDYIVRNALKPVLDKCTSIQDLKKIKVLDPACGSGSFLIKALEAIAEKYKEFGSDNEHIKRQIILENIYGVDLDMQAVEIARLNLLINSLDTKEALPMLDKNIKNGNSLIFGTDEELEKQFGKNWRDKKPFNWQEEFPSVFKQGGFDVIIGNPPYIRNRDLDDKDKEFFDNKYYSASGQYDIYQLFFEQSINLLKENGFLGFITSNKYAIADYGKKLREFILDNCKIVSIIDVSNMQVFKDASTYPYVLILEKEKDNANNAISAYRTLNELNLEENKIILNQNDIKNSDAKNFTLKEENEFIKKIEDNSVRLGDIATIKETIHTGNVRSKLIVDEKLDENCKKLLAGKDCHRYWFKWNGKYIRYDKSLIDKKNKEYANLVDQKYFDNPKILLREIALNIECCLDTEKYYTLNKVYSVQMNQEQNYSLKYILVLLNSKLLSFYFRQKFGEAHVAGGYLQFKKIYTTQIPIFKINFKNKQAKEKHDDFVKLADKMLFLNKELREVPEHSDKWESVKSEIEKTDKKIDEEVYRLYGLTEEEIKIVEGN